MLNRILYYLSMAFIVLPYEGAMRLWRHLDPRVYSAAARIRAVTPGRAPRRGEKYILLAMMTGHRFPAFTRSLIEAAARTGFNLVIIPNGNLTPAFREELLDHAHLLIEREGLGRDFGAYKDGIAIVRERFPDIERLLLMNDSVFYFEKGLDEMLRGLEGPADLIGTCETFEFHYHIQSFILSFSRALMDHPRFQQYWRSYRPITTRRWAIHKGEVGFTRKMMKAGIRPHILYHSAALGSYLRGRPPREILEAIRYLPSGHRINLSHEFDGLLQVQMKASRSDLSLMSRSLRSLPRRDDGVADSFPRDGLSEAKPATSGMEAVPLEVADVLALNSQYQRWQLDGFVDHLLTVVTRHNQCHVGGFLFVKYLGSPIVKRDLFLRTVYSLSEIYDILGDFQEPMREEVMADLRQRGSADNIKGLARILHKYGAI